MGSKHADLREEIRGLEVTSHSQAHTISLNLVHLQAKLAKVKRERDTVTRELSDVTARLRDVNVEKESSLENAAKLVSRWESDVNNVILASDVTQVQEGLLNLEACEVAVLLFGIERRRCLQGHICDNASRMRPCLPILC